MGVSLLAEAAAIALVTSLTSILILRVFDISRCQPVSTFYFAASMFLQTVVITGMLELLGVNDWAR